MKTRGNAGGPVQRQRRRCLVFVALLALCLSLALTGRGQPVAPDPALALDKPSDDMALVDRLEDLPLEDRRYLLYLHARANQPAVAEALALRILRDNPGDRQTLLVLAALYVERREAGKALDIGRVLVFHHPDDDQALYFLAAAYYLNGQYQEAKTRFRQIRDRFYPSGLYPYQNDLASSSLQAQDWYRAMIAYQDLVERHQIGDELRLQARRILEGLYREHLPRLTLGHASQLLRSGANFREIAAYRRHLQDRLRVTAELERGDVHIEASPSLQERWHTTHEGRLRAEYVWSPAWQSKAWLGASEVDPLGGVALTRRLGEQRSLELGADLGRRATDSLLLESLSGREHRLSLTVSYALNRSWLAYGELYGRELLLDHQRYGLSLGTLGHLERILFAESPEVRVGYRWNLMFFSQELTDPSALGSAPAPGLGPDELQSMLAGLVVPELNRQGIYARIQNSLSGVIDYYATVGVDYAFERSSFEYDFEGGFSVYPRKSLELRSAVGYASSPGTSDQNSYLWRLMIGLQYWF